MVCRITTLDCIRHIASELNRLRLRLAFRLSLIWENRDLNKARSKPDTVNRPVRTARTTVHHYNSTVLCATVVAQRQFFFLIFLFLQTIITSQMWPGEGKGGRFILIIGTLQDQQNSRSQYHGQWTVEVGVSQASDTEVVDQSVQADTRQPSAMTSLRYIVLCPSDTVRAATLLSSANIPPTHTTTPNSSQCSINYLH